MINVVIKQSSEISINNVNEVTPIFVKDKKDKLIGMVVKEEGGWITKIGGSGGASGHYDTRSALIEYEYNQFGHKFFIEEK